MATLDRTVLLALVVDSLEVQVAVVDAGGTIVEVNRAWNEFGARNGLPPGTAGPGVSYLAALQASAACGDPLALEAEQSIREVLEGARPDLDLEYPCHSPERERWFMMRVAPLRGSEERLFVILHQDITRRKLAEARAEHMALHDPLTGLANRRYFSRFLSEELRRGARQGTPVGLVVLDVDDFKGYNDALGHVAGDRCLSGVGEVLAAHARRATDLAARIGGDEFALVLGNTDLAGAGAIAQAVRAAVAELRFGGVDARRVTLSAGTASAPPGGKQTEGGLLQEADKALYAAKAAGGNRVRASARS